MSENTTGSSSSSASARPLSPHISLYRPQITWVMSITHRIMGVALAVGSILLVYWLASLAGGPESYARANALFSNPLIILMLLGWCFAFFYHLLNGVRHLIWDAGKGFEMETVTITGIMVIVGAAVLTLVVFITALMKGVS